ncbi:MAG: AAA family ATPase [Halanaerobiales bacterium]
MYVEKIKVENFKSFRKLEAEFNDLNIFIGANAAGKSSFVRLFAFIRDIALYGLKDAVSLQGGIEYLRNLKIGGSEPFSLEIELSSENRGETVASEFGGGEYLYRPENIDYNFSLDFSGAGNGSSYEIVEDTLEIEFTFLDRNSLRKTGSVCLLLKGGNGDLEVELTREGVEVEKNDIIPSFSAGAPLRGGELLIQKPLVFTIVPALEKFFRGISLYDFDPNLTREVSSVSGRAELEREGSNLALVLKNILDSEENRRKILNLMRDILPFVRDLKVDRIAERSLIFKLQEEYSGEDFIPSALLSDGTINITALIVALYFSENRMALFEEPERNIHPHLISRVVEMFYDAAGEKQVFATTHNPEMVKYVDLHNLFLVQRSGEGFSSIVKPIEKEEVKVFLSQDMGIDDLYIQNLLEV